MIVFEWDWDFVEQDPYKKGWFIGCTSVKGEDKPHATEIYEQIDANTAGWGIGV